MEFNGQCSFLYKYNWFVIVFVLIPQTIYGFVQGQTVSEYIDAVRGATYLLLSAPLLKLFIYHNKTDRVMDMIALLTTISLGILLANSFVLNMTGTSLLPYDYFQMPSYGRSNRLRILLISNFLSFVSIYAFSNLLSGFPKKVLNIATVCIALGAEFYVEQTRMIELGIIASFLIIFSMKIKKKRYKILIYFSSVCIALFGIINEWFAGFWNTFSIENSKTGISTLIRTIELKAAVGLIFENPILGTGMVANYRLPVTISGHSIIYDHTDIGIIGTVTYIGIIGTLVLFVFPYCRCVNTLVHIPEQHRETRDYYFLIGIVVYVTLTAGTILITDNARIFVWPFILAFEEYARLKYRYDHGKREEGVMWYGG